MRLLHESRVLWGTFFKNYNSTASLKHDVLKNKHESSPCDLGIRSVCWKLFLLFPTFHPSTWSPHLYSSRTAYSDLRNKLLTPLEQGPLSFADPDKPIDPLAEDDSNPWSQLRKDEELRKEILLDVERCMPDFTYFRSPVAQKRLLDILFIYCKLNQDVSYRQGMHEILAPILWVVDNDAIAVEDEGISSPISADDRYMLEVLDAAYIEHDAFSLFQVIMRAAKAWYELGEDGGIFGTGAKKANSPIVEKSRIIHETYLTAVDPGLGAHLKELDVLPQVFLIRWIRLLFGREFPFNQLLVVWDCLFAEDPNFVLVDFICVAMLLRIRWQLIEADYSTAITLLLRYPSPPPPSLPASFVSDAIYLKANLSSAGGAKVIAKYSNRTPVHSLVSPSRSPFGSITTSRTRPLSPVRFMQTQAGLEGIVQDVARGVLDRGEKWGVNKAVREVMGEVRRNVEGLQISQPTSPNILPSIGSVTAEKRLFSELKKKIKEDEERQKALGKLLALAIDDVEILSKRLGQPGADAINEESNIDPETMLQGLKHIRDCLLDPVLPLNKEEKRDVDESPQTPILISPGAKSSNASTPWQSPPSRAPAISPIPPNLPPLPPSALPTPSIDATAKSQNMVSSALLVASPISPKSPVTPPLPQQHAQSLPATPPNTFPKTAFRSNPDSHLILSSKQLQASSTSSSQKSITSPSSPGTTAHLRARSSLAQSNFAWMLGEDPLAVRNKSAFGGSLHEDTGGSGGLFGDSWSSDRKSKGRRGSQASSGSKEGGKGIARDRDGAIDDDNDDMEEIDLFGSGGNRGNRNKLKARKDTWGPAAEEGLDLGSLMENPGKPAAGK